MIAALIRSARQLDQPEHRAEASHLLLELNYLRGVSPATLETSMAIRDAAHPRGPGLVFHQGAANFPWISHAQWFLEQMYRWEQLRADLDTAGIAARVYRPDIFREAADAVGEPYPLSNHKPEGLHAQPWTVPGTAGDLSLGSDLFFDGAVFDPKRPVISGGRSPRALPLSRF
jgi:nitrate/nitrite transport system substrate-binding protein